MNNKELIGMLENVHFLRKLFVRRLSADSPLHCSQVAIMHIIEENENCTQVDVAEKLGVTPASVATSTKRLQKAGLIEKRVDPENLRCKRLTLTPAGRESICRHKKRFDDLDSRIFESFSDEDKARLADYLNRISDVMKKEVGIESSPKTPMELSIIVRNELQGLSEAGPAEKE